MPEPNEPDFSGIQSGSSSTAGQGGDAAAARTHTVRKGDSLSKIAKEVYGDASQWRRIYEANRDVVGNNPDLIHPGQVLKLPPA